MRKVLFAANWKMNKTREEVKQFFSSFLQKDLPSDREILFAASPTLLYTLSSAVKGSGIFCAAQNMFHEEHGAFTGETSPVQITNAGCTHVLIGHSERRHLFSEGNEVLNKKLHAAQQFNLTPIYCVGETIDERKAGKAEEAVLGQLNTGLKGLDNDFIESVIIAYEPVWAIGTGYNATPEQAEAMHALIRKHVPNSTRILYGGSVNTSNAQSLIDQESIDGFLVGGASLDPEEFRTILSVQLS